MFYMSATKNFNTNKYYSTFSLETVAEVRQQIMEI